MLDGNKTKISLKDGGAYLNDSMIIATDVEGGNGFVHVIDTVLLPPSKYSHVDQLNGETWRVQYNESTHASFRRP